MTIADVAGKTGGGMRISPTRRVTPNDQQMVIYVSYIFQMVIYMIYVLEGGLTIAEVAGKTGGGMRISPTRRVTPTTPPYTRPGFRVQGSRFKNEYFAKM